MVSGFNPISSREMDNSDYQGEEMIKGSEGEIRSEKRGLSSVISMH